jgi:hypothetical protein
MTPELWLQPKMQSHGDEQVIDLSHGCLEALQIHVEGGRHVNACHPSA